MIYKQLLLAIASISIVVVFFNTKMYGGWYDAHVGDFKTVIYDELDSMDYETRKMVRWGAAYSLAKGIKNVVGDKDSIVIVPPTSYIKPIAPYMSMPEPITFYYFTGLKTSFIDGRDAKKAAFAIIIVNGAFALRRIKDTASIGEYRKLYTQK